MLPTRTLLSKSIKRWSFCLTTYDFCLTTASLINVSYYPYQKIEKIQVFFWLEVAGGNFSGIIINISLNLESIIVHKSLDSIGSSFIINNFTSDNLFLKAALDLSFEPSNFVLGLIAKPPWMVAPPIFAAVIPVGPSKESLSKDSHDLLHIS